MAPAALAQDTPSMVQMCTEAGETQSLCACGQAQADQLMAPELQDLVVIGMLTGKPPRDRMTQLGVNVGDIFDLMARWSAAVEANCSS